MDEPGRTIARIARGQHGVFALRQARAIGMSESAVRHRLRTGVWVRLGPAIAAFPGAPRTWHQRLMSAVLAAGGDAMASHHSAAVLWRVPGFRSEPLHVTRRRRPHHPGLIGTVHEPRIKPAPVIVDGIPVTSAARTLADLAGFVSAKRLERAVDNALAMEIVTLEGLRREVRRGRRGAGKLKRILDERSDGYTPPASELESLFADLVKRYGLPAPDRQVSVGDGDGPVKRIDFIYRQARLIVELDSRRYHIAKLDFDADKERDARLAAEGWRIIPVTWKQLKRKPAVVASRIRRALRVAA